MANAKLGFTQIVGAAQAESAVQNIDFAIIDPFKKPVKYAIDAGILLNSGALGATYTLQESLDGATWVEVKGATALAEGGQRMDSDVVGLATKYLRVVITTDATVQNITPTINLYLVQD